MSIASCLERNEASGVMADPFAEPVRGVRFEDCYWYTTMEVPGHGVVQGDWDLRDFFDAN